MTAAPSKLLTLSVSAGNGHVRAAQALVAAAEQGWPGWAALHIDAMDHVAPSFRKLYTDWYIQLVNRAPGLWSVLHAKSDSTPHTASAQRLRRGIERLSAQALLQVLRREKADAIVCTHFLPAELLMRERRRGHIDCPVWLQVTDFDLHNMWLVPDMDGYFAASEEVAWRMRARGLPAERIHVTGIPVMPAFAPGEPLSREACVQALGLNPARRTLLVASGGAGMGDLPSLARRLLALQGLDFQLIVVAGRNAQALAELQALQQQQPQRLHAVGFTQEMEKLMAAADLVMSKPGGLTISECLAMGRPMLLTSPIPGQEEHNASYLLEEGAAWLAWDDIGVDYKVARLMADAPRLQVMAARSRALGRPHAARTVLEQVLGAAQAAVE